MHFVTTNLMIIHAVSYICNITTVLLQVSDAWEHWTWASVVMQA